MSAQLNNAQNWRLAYQDYKESVQATPEGGYYPLPAFEVPILFSSKILVAKTVSNIPPRKRWRWAGSLSALQNLPVGLNTQKSEIISHSLYLNKSKLLIYPDLTSNFELILSGAFWLRDLQLTIYEFTGVIQSTTDLLKDIEFKIDDIASYGR
ncbi:MAG: hypothetical protein HC836_34535 [Richelia sp. RM2_1_2]|nr:hypothetical protein [Richelia sp. RM1_1_1]NJO63154.1 hypothetical protein [Richelia sp. RM2_1_2]